MSAGHEGEEPIDDALLHEAAARALTCVVCGDTDPGAEGIAGAVLMSQVAAELLAAREALRAADALAEVVSEEEGQRMEPWGWVDIAAALAAYRAARAR